MMAKNLFTCETSCVSYCRYGRLSVSGEAGPLARGRSWVTLAAGCCARSCVTLEEGWAPPSCVAVEDGCGIPFGSWKSEEILVRVVIFGDDATTAGIAAEEGAMKFEKARCGAATGPTAVGIGVVLPIGRPV